MEELGEEISVSFRIKHVIIQREGDAELGLAWRLRLVGTWREVNFLGKF